jgi:hypothetical protein
MVIMDQFSQKVHLYTIHNLFLSPSGKKMHHKKTIQWGINIRNIRNMSGL